MILYKLSKWMEERDQLTRVIQESKGDVSLLQYKIDQSDEQMRAHTNQWMKSGIVHLTQ